LIIHELPKSTGTYRASEAVQGRSGKSGEVVKLTFVNALLAVGVKTSVTAIEMQI
jgi:hypothetical protein